MTVADFQFDDEIAPGWSVGTLEVRAASVLAQGVVRPRLLMDPELGKYEKQRLFYVGEGNGLFLKGLELTGGRTTSWSSHGRDGGAVLVEGGEFRAIDVLFESNLAYGRGGAVYVGSGGTFHFSDCQFKNNQEYYRLPSTNYLDGNVLKPSGSSSDSWCGGAFCASCGDRRDTWWNKAPFCDDCDTNLYNWWNYPKPTTQTEPKERKPCYMAIGCEGNEHDHSGDPPQPHFMNCIASKNIFEGNGLRVPSNPPGTGYSWNRAYGDQNGDWWTTMYNSNDAVW